MGTPGVPLDKEKILKAIKAKKGIVSHAALEMGCSPVTIYAWVKDDEDVRNALDEARALAEEEKKTNIEMITRGMYPKLHEKIEAGDTTAIIYAMKTFGGHSDGSGFIKITITDQCDGKDN